MSSLERQTAGDHLVQFYEDDAQLIDVVSAYIGAGLAAPNEVSVVIATAAHLEAFERELVGRGFGVEAAIADGRLALIDAAAALSKFMVAGLPNESWFKATLAQWLAPGRGRKLRAYGELVNVLWQQGNRAAALQLEELSCTAVKEHQLSLLCAYSLDGFSSAEDIAAFQAVCLRHTHVAPAAVLPSSEADAHLRTIAALEQRARALQVEVERRKQLELELQTADRRRDEFLAMLAHELRNPLAALSSALSLRDRSPQQSEVLKATCDRQLRTLSRLVDDLLDVSRITTGKVELRRETFDLAAIVNRAVQTTRGLVETGAHALDASIGPGEFPANIDPTRLEQVVANLLNNAAKYSPPGSQLSIHLERCGKSAVITVTDNGAGIPRQMLSGIFDLFTQVEPTIDRTRGGLGVGLTVVRRLVEMHGGEVTAHSEGKSKGSQFVVRLPLVERVEAVVGAATTPAPTPTVRRRVLLVEDNSDVRETLKELLEDLGHEVHVASDGPSGVKKLLEMNPDVALVDVGLPGIDGFEVARQVRAASQHTVHLVALTGYGGKEVADRAVAAGFNRHVLKPIHLDDLPGLIATPAALIA